MKPLLLIIQLICAHLFGAMHVQATDHHVQPSTVSRSAGQECTDHIQPGEHQLMDASDLVQVNAYLFNVEDEDEEGAIRKFLSLAKDCYTGSYLHLCCNGGPNAVYVSNHRPSGSSCKYIVQRVLRI